MSKKAMFFSVYVFTIILLIALPINSKESVLNNKYVFQLRADYLGHAFLFLPWMWLKPIKTFNPSVFLWTIGGVFFAGFTEGIQYLLPYRSVNVNDVFANCSGIILSTMSVRIIQKN